MKALYTQAMADPELAQTLLAKATPARIQAATAYLNSPTMSQRVIGTISRMGAQLGTALALPGQATPALEQR
jgi:hypothetical protein